MTRETDRFRRTARIVALRNDDRFGVDARVRATFEDRAGIVTQYPVQDDRFGIYDASAALVDWDDGIHGNYSLADLEIEAA